MHFFNGRLSIIPFKVLHALKRSRAVVRIAAEELTIALDTPFPSKIKIENRRMKIKEK